MGERIDPRPDSLSPAEFAREVVGRRERDNSRSVDLYRVNELTPPHGPFSRAWLFFQLKKRTLRAVKIGGLTLVRGDSLRELIATAEEWTGEQMTGLDLELVRTDLKLEVLEDALDRPFDRHASLRIDLYVEGREWLEQLLASKLKKEGDERPRR